MSNNHFLKGSSVHVLISYAGSQPAGQLVKKKTPTLLLQKYVIIGQIKWNVCKNMFMTLNYVIQI